MPDDELPIGERGRFQGIEIRLDVLSRQQREFDQVSRASDVARLQPQFLKQFPVKRNRLVGMPDYPFEMLVLIFLDLVLRESLGIAQNSLKPAEFPAISLSIKRRAVCGQQHILQYGRRLVIAGFPAIAQRRVSSHSRVDAERFSAAA